VGGAAAGTTAVVAANLPESDSGGGNEEDTIRVGRNVRQPAMGRALVNFAFGKILPQFSWKTLKSVYGRFAK